MNLEVSDYISLVDLAITTAIGIWIAVVVQRNITTNRAIKDFFITEVQEIKASYGVFLNDVYRNVKSPKSAKDWLKIMTNRLQVIESSLNDAFVVDTKEIIKCHSEIQLFLTGTDEFNDNFRGDSMNLNESSIDHLFSLHTKLLNSFTKQIVTINKAKSRGFWSRRKK